MAHQYFSNFVELPVNVLFFFLKYKSFEENIFKNLVEFKATPV